MADSPKSSVGGAVLIAAVITLLVTAVRLYGEHEGWNPEHFSREPGGKGALVGIVWLVIPFGLWFGRRLAKNGHRPARATRALLQHLLAAGLIAGVAWVSFNTTEDWRLRSYIFNGGAIACALIAMMAWPRAWFVLAGYGILARVPVMVAQYVSIDRGWDNHYAKGPPGSDPAEALFLLTAAQACFWPFAFTTVVGGIFVIIGNSTVRK